MAMRKEHLLLSSAPEKTVTRSFDIGNGSASVGFGLSSKTKDITACPNSRSGLTGRTRQAVGPLSTSLVAA